MHTHHFNQHQAKGIKKRTKEGKMGQEISGFDSNSVEMSKCNIVVVAPMSGDDCLTELRWLPKEAKIIGTGTSLEEFEKNNIPLHEGTILLNVSGTSVTLAPIIRNMPELRWVHSSSAGVEHILCPDIVDNPNITLTNAKGVFSSSLGEYVIGACLHFAKRIPQLENNKHEKNWDRFPMSELRGSTMGILGYGDIGRSCAKLAKAFGMRVLALRRRPELSQNDEYVDEVFGSNDLATVMSESDYLVICTALTPETRGLIGRREMLLSKEGQILINISRGAVIDEVALIDILQKKTPIAGAALDVFTCEPLPKTSPLWELPNLLLSPHNADMTTDFRHQSIKFFTQICHKFLAGDAIVDCVVDKYSGY